MMAKEAKEAAGKEKDAGEEQVDKTANTAKDASEETKWTREVAESKL